MYYIRFLKKPAIALIGPGQLNFQVTAKIVINTDLQDATLQHGASLRAIIQDADGNERWTKLKWPQDGRELSLDWKPLNQTSQAGPWMGAPYALRIATQESLESMSNLDLLFSTLWSQRSKWGIQPVCSSELWPNRNVESRVRRVLVFSDEVEARVEIWEDSGYSLTAHIWDAGLVMSAVLSSMRLNSRYPGKNKMLRAIQNLLGTPGMHILELGTGCGVVGITVAQCFSSAMVQITDLPDAEELAELNVDIARSKGARVEFKNLDWSEDLPDSVKTTGLDLILVSDCTYNTVSIPDLVKTLTTLIQKNPKATVLVATKRRHDSEEMFLDLMNAKKETWHQWPKLSLSLPREDDPDQTIELYMFDHASSIPDK